MKYLDCYMNEYPGGPLSSYKVDDEMIDDAVKLMDKYFNQIVIRDNTHGCNPQDFPWHEFCDS